MIRAIQPKPYRRPVRLAAKQTKPAAKTAVTIRNQFVQMPAFPSYSGYTLHGASIDPDLCWQVLSSAPRWDIDEALPGLRARARDLFISSALASAALQTRTAGTVGAGLRLDAQPDAQTLELDAATAARYDHRIEAAWNSWAERCGADGASLNEIMQAVEMACLQSGDVFVDVRIDQRGRMTLALIEGDRVDSPSTMLADANVCAGVRFNADGKPIAYYVNDLPQFTPGGLFYYTRRRAFVPGYYDTLEARYILPAGGILHAHMPFERPGQARGIPAASKVLLDAKTLDRYKTAEVDAANVAASAALLITHPAEAITAELDAMDSFSAPIDPPCASDGNAPATASVEKIHPALTLKPGAVLHLEPGADVRSFNTGRPNANFSEFCDAYDARICAALGEPLEIVQKKYDSSYSASRAARLDAAQTHSLDRARLIEQVLWPVYRAWLDLNAARLELDGYYSAATIRTAWRQCDFLGEALPSIDPEKEVRAAIAAIGAGLSTRAREARLLTGMDTGTIIRVLADEEQQMRTAGLIKDQNGRPIIETTDTEGGSGDA